MLLYLLGGSFILKTLLNLIYPLQCVTCEATIAEQHGLCGRCWPDMNFITGCLCSKCGLPLPEDTQSAQDVMLCDTCLTQERPWQSARSALLYKGIAKRITNGLKEYDRTDYGQPAALWLERIAQPLLTEQMTIVPMPIPWRTLVKTRYSPSALLAKAIAQQKKPEAPNLLLDALRHNRHTADYKGLPYEDRVLALKPHLQVSPNTSTHIKSKHILLIDVLMTSGATLDAATRVLLENGAQKVSCLTLARSTYRPYI